jgi:hypothetical protein
VGKEVVCVDPGIAGHQPLGDAIGSVQIAAPDAVGQVRRFYLASSLRMRGLRRRRPMELHTIGIDIGNTVFHLVGLNLRGEVVVRKKFSRTQLLCFTSNIHVKLMGMEGCRPTSHSSHLRARAALPVGSLGSASTVQRI